MSLIWVTDCDPTRFTCNFYINHIATSPPVSIRQAKMEECNRGFPIIGPCSACTHSSRGLWKASQPDITLSLVAIILRCFQTIWWKCIHCALILPQVFISAISKLGWHNLLPSPNVGNHQRTPSVASSLHLKHHFRLYSAAKNKHSPQESSCEQNAVSFSDISLSEDHDLGMRLRTL